MLQRLPAACLLLTLGACTVGPDFDPPEWMSPASWFARKVEPIAPAPSMPVAEPIDPNWWNLFNDPILTALERRVAEENLDVQIATTRIAESRAQLGVVGAAQFPMLNGNGSYTRQKASDVGVFANAPNALGASGASGSRVGGTRSSQLSAFDVYQVGFDASWELDLWGKVRRSVESASASVLVSAEARRATLLSNLAELANDYIRLRGVQSQLRIARDNVKIAQQSLQLTQQRAAGGVTTDLDVANAAAQLRTVAAEMVNRWGSRRAAGRAGSTSSSCSSTTCALVPPKPNELTAARRGRGLRARGHGCSVVGIARGVSAIRISGLSWRRLRCGGISPCSSARAALIRPAMPAAASRWPMLVLTDPIQQRSSAARPSASTA